MGVVRALLVPLANASAIFRMALHPKSFVSLDDANHLLTRTRDATFVAGIIVAWASRYLNDTPRPAAEAQPTETRADDRTARVAEQAIDAYMVAFTAGHYARNQHR